MPILLAVLLGIVQGVTEFLPVSSDGHLAIVQIYLGRWLDLEHIPLAFDVALHGATLLVTFVFLRKQVFSILRHLFSAGERGAKARGLVLAGFIASLPVALVGLMWKHQIEASFTSKAIAGLGFLVTGLLLEFAHRRQLISAPRATAKSPDEDPLFLQVPTPLEAFFIGVAQATAVLPGLSRSGSTIAAALLFGIDARSAVYFSFLLALPAVFGAVVLESDSILALPPEYTAPLVIGFLVTTLVGSFAIRVVPLVVTRLKLRAFSLYVSILGVLCLLGAAIA